MSQRFEVRVLSSRSSPKVTPWNKQRLGIWEQLKTENQCKVARGTRASSCNFPELQTWKTEKQPYSEKENMKLTNFIGYQNSSPQWAGMHLRAGSHPGDSETVNWATSPACSRLPILGRSCSLASESLQISSKGGDNSRSTEETLPLLLSLV